MSKTTMTPIEKARLAVYNKMKPATQEVAKQFEEKLGKGATAIVLVQYDMGARVADIVEDENEYGSGAVKQLAEYLSIPGGETMLYGMMNLARTFDKEYVKTNTLRPMTNSHYMSLQHWLQLMKISEEAKRDKMLERILRESMSANDLEKEIRSGAAGTTKNARQGGRKPKTPSSPILGLQTTFQLANKFIRWEEVADKSVFDRLDEIEPDKVNENLVKKTKETLAMVETTIEKATEMKGRLETNVERLEEVMSKKAEAAADEYDEDAESGKKKAGKKAAKPATKASKNGKPDKTGKAPGKDKGKKKNAKKKEKAAVAAAEPAEDDGE